MGRMDALGNFFLNGLKKTQVPGGEGLKRHLAALISWEEDSKIEGKK